MKYLEIRNRGSLNRLYLEVLGLSSKADRMDDVNVIGNRGTGTKIAAIVAKRLGIGTAFTSHDEQGNYFLTFDTEPVDIGGVRKHRVFYRYRVLKDGKITEGRRFPSERVIEAFPDWDKPIGADNKRLFKVLRELVCNGWDEDKKFRILIVSRPSFVPEGETAVYLTHDPEFDAILATPERYFKFLSDHKPFFSRPEIGAIWPKSEEEKTRLFILGVLVDCSADTARTTLFDYSLADKTLLSEERILKESYCYSNEVARLYGELDDVRIARIVLRAVHKGMARFEEDVLARLAGMHIADEAKALWLAAAREEFGEKVAVPSKRPEVNADARECFGLAVLDGASHDLCRFLTEIGVPKADDVARPDLALNTKRVEFEDLDAASKEHFRQAFALFARNHPDRASIPIAFFYALDERSRKAFHGFAGSGRTVFKEIWIATATPTTLTESEGELYLTIWHESCHCVTKAQDATRKFSGRMERDYAELSFREAGLTKFGPGKLVPAFGDGRHKPVFAPALESEDDLDKRDTIPAGKPAAADPNEPEIEIVAPEDAADTVILDAILKRSAPKTGR